MTDQAEPIRKSLLPATPPSEYEFSSVFGAPHGCLLLPVDTGPVVVRRRVTYGDWEPVRPGHWADEPRSEARAAVPADVVPDPTHGLSVQHADALWDAVAIPGPHTPTFPAQHERVCRTVAGIVAELTAVREGPPVDRAALRQRIAAALVRYDWNAGLSGRVTPSEHHYGEADAVLAVLPAPADRAANELASLAVNTGRALQDEKRHYEIACQENARLRATIERLRADRAAVLREVADRLDRKAATLTEGVGDLAVFVAKAQLAEAKVLRREAAELRRLADEAQPATADGCEGCETCELATELAEERTQAATLQVWPLHRILSEVRCGSQDWSWEEEWTDLDHRHADTGYLDQLEAQIRETGITMPVLIGSDGRLWDGHHRLRIAVRAGIEYVPVEITAPAAEAQRAEADLPARLEATLTERYTELGNPFSRMRRQEQGPDGWPAERPVGPHHVAEVLRELLADEQPTDEAQQDRKA
ncbi:ParB N-terminal domain-containing protein [Streptomyces sp. NPDC094153]|uniref:ParB N-terminal domain-containing protein n=1 Tax=Streptomyces sp. NPDC094153 TaxID=3366058 RepID=UPI0037F18234